jgi:hypothetical protein
MLLSPNGIGYVLIMVLGNSDIPYTYICIKHETILIYYFYWELPFYFGLKVLFLCWESWCSGYALDLYMEDAWFKSQLGYQAILTKDFSGVPQFHKATAWILPQSGYNCFLLDPFCFILYQLSYHSTSYILRFWQQYKINYKKKELFSSVNYILQY